MEEICVSFGRYLWWSSHIFMFRGLVQSSRDWQYIMLLIIWLFNLLLTHNSSTCHQISYSCSPCVGPSMHVAWWQMASTSPEGHPPLCDEGGKRRTSFSVSCGFRCPHTLPYMSQFLHAYVHIQLSFTNVTLVDLHWIKLNTKYKYNHFYGLFHQLYLLPVFYSL